MCKKLFGFYFSILLSINLIIANWIIVSLVPVKYS